MTKGYSNMPDSARLVHTFHAWQAGAESDVWFEYVPSKANPADEPSRGKRVRRAAPDFAPDWARRLIAGEILAIDAALPLDPRLQWCCSPTVEPAQHRP